MNHGRIEDLMRKLVGAAYPVPEPAGKNDQMMVRRWLVRTEREIPEQALLDMVAERLTAEVAEARRNAYREDVSEELLSSTQPAASIVRITATHCVVSIEAAAPGCGMGDDQAIATWGILQRLDKSIGVADIEGIPKQFWFAMRG
jgi:hypothetical protein